MTNPTIIPSGIPGGTLLPVYYVSPYRFVIRVRWYTRAPTHTRAKRVCIKPNMNLRSGMEQMMQDKQHEDIKQHTEDCHREEAQETGTNTNKKGNLHNGCKLINTPQTNQSGTNMNKTAGIIMCEDEQNITRVIIE